MRRRLVALLARYLPHAVVAFLLGIAGGSFFSFSLAVILSLFALAALALLVAHFGRAPHAALFSLLLLFFTLGALRPAFLLPVTHPVLDAGVGARAIFEGVVLRDPDVRDDHVNLTVGYLVAAGSATTTLPEHLRVLLIAPRYPEYAYGDRIRFAGSLKHPAPFETDGGLRVFDYPAYLAKDGIGYLIFRPAIERVGGGEGNMVVAALYDLKHAALRSLKRSLPDPAAGLAAGLVFGEKRSLGEEWSERFRAAGLTHIVVLSGHNMTLVADGFAAFLAALGVGFYGRIAGGAVGIVLFATMTGGGATVLRAAIMALLALLARLTGRTSAFGRMLLVAAGAMVAGNPRILLDDPSFQLSFLASLGLVYGAPVIERKLPFLVRTPKLLRETVVATIATQLFVLPLLLYMTGKLSLVALPANLLALPFVGPAMGGAILVALAGLLPDAVGVLAAFPATVLLDWILGVARVVSAVPFAEVSIASFPLPLLFLSYAAIAYLCRPTRGPQLPAGSPESSDSDRKDRAPSPRRS